MKRYKITIPVEGEEVYTVEANSIEDAEQKYWDGKASLTGQSIEPREDHEHDMRITLDE